MRTGNGSECHADQRSNDGQWSDLHARGSLHDSRAGQHCQPYLYGWMEPADFHSKFCRFDGHAYEFRDECNQV